jgi:outer membrane protein TolC
VNPTRRRPSRASALAALALATSLLLGAGGCALQAHDPRPLDTAATQAAWQAARTDDAALREALARRGVDVSTWPLPAWPAEALDALALARHPELDVARAELAVAEAARLAARERGGRGAELGLEHHSADGTVDSPWSVTLALDALLGGAARRAAQADEADALALEAQHAAAEAAWKLRQRVREARRARHFEARRAAAAHAAWDARRELAAAQRKRLERGALDAAEALRAAQEEADAAQQAAQAGEALRAARAAFAAALALPLERADALVLLAEDLEHEPPGPAGAELQRAALLDRLDLRAALARYAAADAALRTEIARQWPELTLRPGLGWDQGDRLWTLGVALALPPGGDNRAAIEQARARRALEAARCRALQSATLAALDGAREALAAAADTERAAAARRDAAREAVARAERRLRSGDADRPELLAARAAETEAQLRWIEARSARWAAAERLEDVVQRPLDAVRTEFAAAQAPGADGAAPRRAPPAAPRPSWRSTPLPTPLAPAGSASGAAAAASRSASGFGVGGDRSSAFAGPEGVAPSPASVADGDRRPAASGADGDPRPSASTASRAPGERAAQAPDAGRGPDQEVRGRGRADAGDGAPAGSEDVGASATSATSDAAAAPAHASDLAAPAWPRHGWDGPTPPLLAASR